MVRIVTRFSVPFKMQSAVINIALAALVCVTFVPQSFAQCSNGLKILDIAVEKSDYVVLNSLNLYEGKADCEYECKKEIPPIDEVEVKIIPSAGNPQTKILDNVDDIQKTVSQFAENGANPETSQSGDSPMGPGVYGLDGCNADSLKSMIGGYTEIEIHAKSAGQEVVFVKVLLDCQ